MKKLFQKSKLKNLYFGGFLFIIAAAFVVSCAKNDDVTINPDFTTQKQTTQQLQELTTLPLSITELNGGTTETILDAIEESLNKDYGVPEQSIGRTHFAENELIISLNSGIFTESQTASLYNSALDFWGDTYNNFVGQNKQALLLDLDSETLQNGDVKVKISAWVGELAEEISYEPCKGGFEDIGYLWSEYYKKSYPNNTIYADGEINKRLNAKHSPKLGKCIYIKTIKTIILPPKPASAYLLNREELDALYCFYLYEVQKHLAANPTLTFGSVNIQGITKQNGANPYGFAATFTLGVKAMRIPCVVPKAPKNFPPNKD